MLDCPDLSPPPESPTIYRELSHPQPSSLAAPTAAHRGEAVRKWPLARQFPQQLELLPVHAVPEPAMPGLGHPALGPPPAWMHTLQHADAREGDNGLPFQAHEPELLSQHASSVWPIEHNSAFTSWSGLSPVTPSEHLQKGETDRGELGHYECLKCRLPERIVDSPWMIVPPHFFLLFLENASHGRALMLGGDLGFCTRQIRGVGLLLAFE